MRDGAWSQMVHAVLTGLLLCLLGLLVGCSFHALKSMHRASWREQVALQCLRSGAVEPSRYVVPLAPIRGRWSCGLEHPFRVSGALDGRVAIQPAATIDCPMTVAINRWLSTSVEAAADRYFGQPVVALKQIASYGCRTRDNIVGAKLSEHSFGNAIDIAGFRLANGQTITVARDWYRGSPQARAFLHAAFNGACATFDTVLGPGADRYHSTHFHLDLLITNGEHGRHFCQPAPEPVADIGRAGRFAGRL